MTSLVKKGGNRADILGMVPAQSFSTNSSTLP